MSPDKKHINGSATPVNWERFDMDKFFKETDAVGRIIEEEKRKVSGN